MSHFAGVVFADNSKPLDDQLCKKIRKTLSRYPKEEIQEFSAPGIYVAKFDVGAIGSAGVYGADNGGFSVLAGDPILQLGRGVPALERSDALPRFHEAVAKREPEIFKAARGSFCCAHYYPSQHRLVLVVDSLGVRALYSHVGAGFMFFATSMRVIEEVDIVPKRMDERGLLEKIGFGYCLSDRTVYDGVRYLDAAEMLTYENGIPHRSHYFQWDSIEPNTISIEEAIDAVSNELQESLRCRLRPGENAVNAFLSGGLDSRLIVTGLTEQVGRVNTFNSSPPTSADRIIGKQFAEAIGSHHFEYAHGGAYIHPAVGLLDAYPEPELARRSQAMRPRTLWSGDGGSVGLGFVFLNETIVSNADSGNIDEAKRHFIAYNGKNLDNNAFTISSQKSMKNYINDSVSKFVGDPDATICSTSLYLFLLLNDQRRHLENQLESMDLSRIDLMLPLLDCELLKIATKIPVREGVYHKFYHKFLEDVMPIACTVPWQTYPDHLPSPLPLPAGATYQWSKTHKWRCPKFRNLLFGLGKLVPPANKRCHLINWQTVFLANLLTSFGFTQYSYILKAAGTVQAYHEKCR